MADVAVVGAGPAGIAAAIAAARHGATVTLIDSAPTIGGQIWRAAAGRHRTLKQPGIRVLSSAEVWRAASTTLSLTSGETVHFQRLILATGASELSLPFPGWDRPGVMTPGGAQALLKGHGVLPGRRVLVAGTGPFLWPVAAGLIQAGASVAALVEAASPGMGIAGLARHPSLLRQAGGYAATLAWARVPILTGHMVVAAAEDSVVVARLDGGGRRTFEVDAVCVGYGFVPVTDLAQSLGCAIDDGAVEVDGDQRTTVPEVYAAGEVTGIGGVKVSWAEGTIAGLAAADAPIPPRLRSKLRHHQHAAAILREQFPIPMEWTDHLRPDTIICRCEEATWTQVCDAIDSGAESARAVKGQTRCGMGWCQGRICGPVLTALTGGELGPRPFAVPIPLRVLGSSPGGD
jgi:NADPH-dependent 2,4-dienoyl-CoA reductase/sulfur reductase-like enzyme